MAKNAPLVRLFMSMVTVIVSHLSGKSVFETVDYARAGHSVARLALRAQRKTVAPSAEKLSAPELHAARRGATAGSAPGASTR